MRLIAASNRLRPGLNGMVSERMFDDEEVAAILDRAAIEDAGGMRPTSVGRGMTLSELKQIAVEAGIAEQAIDRAVRSLPTSSIRARATVLSVVHSVDLPETFSDEDWQRLVFDLHDAILEPGEVRVEGGRRHWKNKDYHVLVEPHELGYRLRLRTLSDGPAVATMAGLFGGGFVFFLMGVFFMVAVAAKGDFPGDLAKTLFVSMFSAVGLLGVGVGAYRMPRWRDEQQRLFEGVAERALERSEQ